MATSIPFLNSYGLVSKIFNKIQEAVEPERYTQNFQGTILGYGSGSALPFIPFLKRLGFLESDGRPTDLYKKFRNIDTSGFAMAQAMNNGFQEIFKRNEYAYKLSDEKLKNLVVEITGKAKTNSSVKAICGSFKAYKQLADFDATIEHDNENSSDQEPLQSTTPPIDVHSAIDQVQNQVNDYGLAFSYTINLNLPETDDPAVYNAIFSALKEHLLKK